MNKYIDKIAATPHLVAKVTGGVLGVAGAAAAGLGVASEIAKKELNKQSGVQDWFDDLSGSKVNKTKNIMEGLRHATASGKNYADYAKDLSHQRNATAKVRVKTGLGAAGVIGAGLYGLHAYKKHQKEEILKAYAKLYEKQAGVTGTIFDATKGAVHKVIKGVGTVGRAAGSVSNTALGGKIKTFANNSGIAHGSKEMNTFNKSNRAGKLNMLKNKLPPAGPNRTMKSKELRKNFSDLTKDQTNARIIAGAIPAAGIIGYHKGQSDEKNNQTANYY